MNLMYRAGADVEGPRSPTRLRICVESAVNSQSSMKSQRWNSDISCKAAQTIPNSIARTEVEQRRQRAKINIERTVSRGGGGSTNIINAWSEKPFYLKYLYKKGTICAKVFRSCLPSASRLASQTLRYLRLRDGGDELDDAVGDGLLELEAALLPEEGGQEAHQHAVLERVLEA